MRISDVSNVTGIPLTTLKDLRHRSILELATGGPFQDDPEEIRRWGSFSVPAVIYIMGADEVRKRYGLSWQDAICFVKTALCQIRIPIEGYPPARFFDLGAVDQEIWAGRFDFKIVEPDLTEGWNYFSGTIDQVPAALARVNAHRDEAHARMADRSFTHNPIQQNDVAGCIMINASHLCRAFWENANKHNALRDWENR